VLDVQPLIDTTTRAPIKSNGNAYLSGVLMYRFIILTIGFIYFPHCFAQAVNLRHKRDAKRWVVETQRDSLSVILFFYFFASFFNLVVVVAGEH
jgi:hypothetical protein